MSIFTSPVFMFGMVTGMVTPICSKMMYQVDSVGIDGEVRPFVKPWFKSTWMFTAMSMALVLHYIRTSRCMRASGYAQVDAAPKASFKTLMKIVVPSAFDYVATVLSGIGLVVSSVATYQMLRGSLTVWGALLSVAVLGKKLKPHNWWGVFICFVATCIVGLAGIMSGAATSTTSFWMQVAGVLLILAAQVVQASQFICEQLALHDLACEPLQLVGMEGVWGVVLGMLIVNPIVYMLPGDDVGGHYENFFDSVVKFENSSLLQLVLFAYWFSVLGYNWAAVSVTKQMSAVHHTLLDGLRTGLVWGADLFLFHATGGSFGEAWTKYSYVQLVGFALMVYGTLAYDGNVKLPWLDYSDVDLSGGHGHGGPSSPEALTSPALLRSPLLERTLSTASPRATHVSKYGSVNATDASEEGPRQRSGSTSAL